MPEGVNNITPEAMMKLQSRELTGAVLKLITNKELNEKEITILATYSYRDLATVAIHLTSEQLMQLQDPMIILSTIASFHMNASKHASIPQELSNYQKNMMIIQSIQEKNKKELVVSSLFYTPDTKNLKLRFIKSHIFAFNTSSTNVKSPS